MYRWALLTVLTVACGAATPAPVRAVDLYVAALEAGDFGRAYDLMSSSFREQHKRDDFVRRMKESPAEVRETAARMRAGQRRVHVSAHLKFDDLNDELQLVEEGEGWRIANDPLDFYPQDTPARTLRSFVRAVELKRYDILLRFVPDKWKAGMTADKLQAEFEGERREEIGALMRALTANLDNAISQQGDEARMPYGDRFEVRFVREGGSWKISDPE
jgi:hypothetical protein